MAQFKAVLKNKSNVDRAGNIKITFDVFKDTELLFPDLTVSCNPANVTEYITSELSKIQLAEEQASLITIGTEITL